MMKRLYIILLVLFPLLASGQITLLKDINNALTTSSSNPSNLTLFNGAIYFTASDGVTGSELWKTDGTAAGTVQVKDINPGDNSSNPSGLTVVGSFLYFAANDGDNGSELWRTDGTANGTIMVADINPGVGSSSPSNLLAIGTTQLYFSATDSEGNEPWKSIVATKATTKLLDINSGSLSSSPGKFTFASGTTAYFVATDAAGSELWKTDGTSTVRLSNINATGNSNPNYLTMFNGSVYFSADDGSTNGVELWASNGAAPTLIKNINPTANAGSGIFNIVAAGSYIYFGATDGTTGTELWRSDGTAAGTAIVTDLNVGTGGSIFSIVPIVPVGTSVYFYANANTGLSAELYRCTSAGVVNVIDINTGAPSSGPNYLANINGTLFLQATTATTGYEMVRVSALTPTVTDLLPGTSSSSPRQFTSLDGTANNVIFTANNGNGIELWKWNGTSASMITDLVTGSDGSNPYNFASTSTATFFQANDGTGTELWRTDGVDGTSTHTYRVKDINAAGASSPSSITAVGSTVFFSAFDGTDTELWRTDGTLNNATKIDLNPGVGSSFPYGIVARTATEIVMVAYHDTYGTELVKVNTSTNAVTWYDIYPGNDGVDPYTSDPSELTLFGTTIYFSAANATAGRELFKFDGTTVSVVQDLVVGTGSSDPYSFSVVSGVLYYQAYTAALGYEPYKYTGFGSPSLILDINPGAASSNAYGFTGLGSFVFFYAENTANGGELWRTDGTAANTKIFKDTYPGATSGGPNSFFVYNGAMYFNARDAANGIEMWKTDGAADANGLATSSTAIFKDINVGAISGGFYYPTIVGTKMVFIGLESSGARVYITDGRSCGTLAATPYAGGVTASALYPATVPGSKVVFSMVLQGSGRELFLFDPSQVTFPTDVAINTQPTNQTVTMPASASFTVAASGSGLTYQWQKNSVNINGATSATYTIPTTTDTDAGSYRVVVTGTCGQLTSNAATLTVNASTPTAQPTALVFTSPTQNSINVGFTAATGNPTGYLVLRKLGSAPAEVPVDGTTYTAGSTLGTSTVVRSSSALSGNDTGLTAGTEYFYKVFSYNGTGSLVKYLTTSPLQGSGFTVFPEPADQPTSLVFSNLDGTTLTVSFTAAASAPTGYLVIRKAGSAPTGIPSDGKSYNTGDVLGDATVAYLGPNVTFNDSGLTPETTYFYQVFSARGVGPTLNYRATSPLQGSVKTLASEPLQPTALTFSNVTTNSFTVSYTAPAQAPTGYLVFRNAGSAPTTTPTDGTVYTLGSTVGDARVAYVGSATTFDETLPLAVYHYAVYAYNGSSNTTNYRIVAPLTGLIGPDNSAPSITNETAAAIAAGTGVKVVASVSEPQTSIQTVSVTYKSVSSSATATTQPMALVGGKYEYSIPAAEIGDLGVEYTINASNSVGLTGTSTGKVALTLVSQTLPFSSFGSSESNYRIIAVPLDLTSKSVNDVFADDIGTPYDGVNWRMYRYDNGANSELSGTSQLELGKGYWLIVKNSVTLTLGAGKTASVSSASPFTIDLKAGWNQIGNPYPFNVLWSDVLAASGVNLDLVQYTGSFTPASVLQKYTGGFVFTNAAATLTIPVVKNGAAGRTMETEPLREAIDQDEWEVMLDLKVNNITNPFGGIGMGKAANEWYDESDNITLPRFMDYVELNHNKTIFNNSFTKDVVPTASNHTWEFTVEASKTGSGTITWDNSYFGINDRQLILWDYEASLPVNMREESSYSFQLNGSRRFKIFYGDESYVSENTSKSVVMFHQVFPNPADGVVNFTFTIPGKTVTPVEINVMNSLGQPVSSIYRGELQGGFHQMTWSGKDNMGQRPTQGVYLIEVMANGQKIAKRVVLR